MVRWECEQAGSKTFCAPSEGRKTKRFEGRFEIPDLQESKQKVKIPRNRKADDESGGEMDPVPAS